MVCPLFVAIGCLAALVLITVAVTRGIPRVVWITALCVVGVVTLLAVVISHVISEATKNHTEQREVSVTPQYAASVREAGFPISVQRAFEASSQEVFHGDGARLTAYRFPPAETETLVTALKRRNPTFSWSAIPQQRYDFSSMRNLIPQDFLPEPDSGSLLIGSPADGPPVEEFVIERSKGILYRISNQF